jgi:hypothetical protein
VNDAEYLELQRRIDLDINRVSADTARRREKKAATKTPRRVSLKAYVANETCGVLRPEAEE